MGDPRPDQPGTDPREQAQYLRPTGNEPTVDNEEGILADEFGEPNSDGTYGAPTEDGGDTA
ncbi:hypothetical protein ACIHCX_03545 [Streptomyces sp. NPDC052043]|uniref:hypothetical protein n=1 Tax=Streptomyces sp. NPDC052043 TaxID=3365684 RepID=UPI0037D59959